MPLDHYVLGGKDGKDVIPVDMLTWAGAFGSSQDRRVAETTIKEPNRFLWALGARPDYWVSTVFLGLNHNFGRLPPHIFETMVFRKWPRWKAWLSELRLPRRIGSDGFLRNEKFLPPRTGWVADFSWLGYHRLIPIQNPYNRLVRWWRYNFHRFHPTIPYSWGWSENLDLDMDRYSTWDEAEKGHRRMVAKWASPKRGGEGG